MGANSSKEQHLYQVVKKGNHDAVKAYRRDGASLEWVDKKGRTPLILACSRNDLVDMTITLLNLGASLNAYRPGSHGGFPLHHAARKGLDKTVTLLLYHGADPFSVNDDGHTPLEVARRRGHTSVVRLLEERVAIFTGMLRELSGPGILESVVPKLCMKKTWVVVIPTNSPGRTPNYELAMYTSPKISMWTGVHPSASHPAGLCNVAHPRAVIQLSKVELGEPEFTLSDPILHIIDKRTKTRYKFLSGVEGDKVQLEKLYKACKGIPQNRAIPASSTALGSTSSIYVHDNNCQIHPLTLQQNEGSYPGKNLDLFHNSGTLNFFSPCKLSRPETVLLSDDMELALAIDASINSAAEQGICFSTPSSRLSLTDYMWEDHVNRSHRSRWASAEFNNYHMWDAVEVGTSMSCSSCSSADAPSTDVQVFPIFQPQPTLQQILFDDSTKLSKHPSVLGASKAYIDLPSAPPLPQASTMDDTNTPTLFEMESSSSFDKTHTENVNETCVLCWDALAEGVCIPCGHMASCMNCLSEVRKNDFGCPICRAPIQQTIKVYRV